MPKKQSHRKTEHGPLTRYVKLQFAHAPVMPVTFSQASRVSDPDMHHGTCVTHVPWCMSGSVTRSFLWSRWWGKLCRHSRRMRNLQFYVSGKRPIGHCGNDCWWDAFGKCNVIRCWHWLICIYIQLQFNRIRTHSLMTKCFPVNIILEKLCHVTQPGRRFGAAHRNGNCHLLSVNKCKGFNQQIVKWVWISIISLRNRECN